MILSIAALAASSCGGPYTPKRLSVAADKLALADRLFDRGSYRGAAAEYKDFGATFAGDERSDYAQYRLAETSEGSRAVHHAADAVHQRRERRGPLRIGDAQLRRADRLRQPLERSTVATAEDRLCAEPARLVDDEPTREAGGPVDEELAFRLAHELSRVASRRRAARFMCFPA